MLLVIDKFVGGLHSNAVSSKVQLAITDATCAYNVEFYPRGTVSRRMGYATVSSSAVVATGNNICRIGQFTDYQNKDYTLVFTYPASTGVSGEIYSLFGSPATLTRILCASTAGPTGWWTTSASNVGVSTYEGSGVFICGSDMCPWIWNGNTSDIPTYLSGAPSGSKTLATWYGYIFLGNVLVSGIRQHSRVYWNQVGDKWTWPDSYYLDLDPDDGDSITAMKMLRDVLVVFKYNKIFNVQWVGGSLLFDFVRVSTHVGCVGPRAVVEVRGILYFLANDGLYSYDGNTITYLSDKVRDRFLLHFNHNAASISEVVYYEKHQQIWVSIAEDGSDTKNRVYVYDLMLGSWSIYDLACDAIGAVAWGENIIYANFPDPYNSYDFIIGEQIGAKSSQLLLALYGRTLYQFGDIDTDNGKQFNSIWRSIWMDFGSSVNNKRITRLSALFDRQSTTESMSAQVTIYKDWIEPSTAAGSAYTVTMCGTNNLLERRVNFTKYVRAFAFDVQGTRPWTLHRVVIDYLPKGRTLV